MEKQHDKIFTAESWRFLAYCCIIAAVMILGFLAGSLASAYSYRQAFDDGDIHVCTPQEIDTQQLINEYNKCIAKKDFVNNLNGSFTNIYKSPTK